MSQAIKRAAIDIINEVYPDLAEALAQCGEEVSAEALADAVGDRLVDSNAEYRGLPYTVRRARVLEVCQLYA